MRIDVKMFGHYRDIAGDGQSVELAGGTTVRQLADQLAQRDQRLSLLSARCRAAVNAEYVPADTVLNDGDEVAFIPPMSGG